MSHLSQAEAAELVWLRARTSASNYGSTPMLIRSSASQHTATSSHLHSPDADSPELSESSELQLLKLRVAELEEKENGYCQDAASPSTDTNGPSTTTTAPDGKLAETYKLQTANVNLQVRPRSTIETSSGLIVRHGMRQ